MKKNLAYPIVKQDIKNDFSVEHCIQNNNYRKVLSFKFNVCWQVYGAHTYVFFRIIHCHSFLHGIKVKNSSFEYIDNLTPSLDVLKNEIVFYSKKYPYANTNTLSFKIETKMFEKWFDGFFKIIESVKTVFDVLVLEEKRKSKFKVDDLGKYFLDNFERRNTQKNVIKRIQQDGLITTLGRNIKNHLLKNFSKYNILRLNKVEEFQDYVFVESIVLSKDCFPKRIMFNVYFDFEEDFIKVLDSYLLKG